MVHSTVESANSKLTKEKAGKAARAVIFLLITGVIFVIMTYLFRTTTFMDRRSLLYFYEEEEDQLDVVYIGSSAVYRYWNPMEAWEKYGYTSIAYSSAAMTAKTFHAAISEVEKRQSDAVIMLEARCFFPNRGEVDELIPADRRVFDSMDFGIDRFKAIYTYQKNLGLSFKDLMPEYIDLMFYHNNYYALWNKLHWQLADNRLDGVEAGRDAEFRFKRYSLKTKEVPMPDPIDNMTDARGDITESRENYFRTTLEYAQKHGLKVVVVSSPFIYSEEEYSYLNTLSDIAAEYGVDFVNSNADYETVGTNYETDFYNTHHMNMSGANKFTDYISEYMVKNYTFSTDKSEATLASWNETYRKYQEALANRVSEETVEFDQNESEEQEE